MLEHDRRQIRAAFKNVESKSALMIGESAHSEVYPIHHAFHESCEGRRHAVRLGFDDDAFDLSVRMNVVTSPADFLEVPFVHPDAVERIELALRLVREFELKIICCFGLNAKLALVAALKPERELNLYHFNARDHKKPWIYCFDHPAPANPIWNAEYAGKTKRMFEDQASFASRRIVSMGWTKLRRARRAAALHLQSMRA